MLALGCLGEGEVIPHRVLRLLLGLPAEAAPFGDPLEDAVEDLFQRSVLERPAEDAVRLHPLVHGIAARHGAGFRDTLAETAAATLHGADFWAGKTGDRHPRSAFRPVDHPAADGRRVAGGPVVVAAGAGDRSAEPHAARRVRAAAAPPSPSRPARRRSARAKRWKRFLADRSTPVVASGVDDPASRPGTAPGAGGPYGLR